MSLSRRRYSGVLRALVAMGGCAVLTGAALHTAPGTEASAARPEVVVDAGAAPVTGAAPTSGSGWASGGGAVSDDVEGVPNRPGQVPARGTSVPVPVPAGTPTPAVPMPDPQAAAPAPSSVADGPAVVAPARPVAGGTTTTRLTAGRAAVQEFDTDVALGAWPGDGSAPSAYPGMLSYRDGSEATNGAGGAEGVYHPSKVLSVHDGVLDWWCRDAKAAAVLPFGYEGFTHGTYTVRMRTDDFAGYHIAFLLWPTSDRWSHELDGPEGETSDAHPYPAVLQGTDPVSFAPTQRVVTPASWHDPVMHDYTWQWGPGFVAFYQDGVQVTRVTTNVPDEPMRPVLQVEWSNSGERPDPAVSGHVYVDRISYDPRWTIPVA